MEQCWNISYLRPTTMVTIQGSLQAPLWLVREQKEEDSQSSPTVGPLHTGTPCSYYAALAGLWLSVFVCLFVFVSF